MLELANTQSVTARNAISSKIDWFDSIKHFQNTFLDGGDRIYELDDVLKFMELGRITKAEAMQIFKDADEYQPIFTLGEN